VIRWVLSDGTIVDESTQVFGSSRCAKHLQRALDAALHSAPSVQGVRRFRLHRPDHILALIREISSLHGISVLNP